MMSGYPLLLPPDSDGIQTAAEILQDGRLVAFPTETVYGLGGDATNDHAVAAIFEAKGRPSFNPLIVHFPDSSAVWPHVDMDTETDKLVRMMAGAFWPGPLTMVLGRSTESSLSLLVSAGLDTVAVRVPSHPVAHDLLTATGLPLAAPSANRSGSISPTQADHVLESLDGKIDAVVDGGRSRIGIESTVISFHTANSGRPILLRPGGISREDIETLIGPIDVVNTDETPSILHSPGMLKRHYAPETQIRLNASSAQPEEVLLGFGPSALTGAPDGSLNLSETGDLREAAANLFAMMRRLDAMGKEAIAVTSIPETGLGLAINDRLRRAATPENP